DVRFGERGRALAHVQPRRDVRGSAAASAGARDRPRRLAGRTVNVDNLCMNRTLFTVRSFVLDDRHGREVLVVCAKIAYEIGEDGRLALSRRSVVVRPFDVPWWTKPGSSARYPSDWIDEKPGTDVLLVGTAEPPRGDVGAIDVTLRIWADRPRLA